MDEGRRMMDEAVKTNDVNQGTAVRIPLFVWPAYIRLKHAKTPPSSMTLYDTHPGFLPRKSWRGTRLGW